MRHFHQLAANLTCGQLESVNVKTHAVDILRSEKCRSEDYRLAISEPQNSLPPAGETADGRVFNWRNRLSSRRYRWRAELFENTAPPDILFPYDVIVPVSTLIVVLNMMVLFETKMLVPEVDALSPVPFEVT